MMNTRYMSKLTYEKITVFTMLFYCYMYTMTDFIFRQRFLVYAVFIFALIMCFIPCLIRRCVIFDKYTMLWALCLIIAVLHNRRLLIGDFAPKMMCWFVMISIMLLIRNKINWIGFFEKWIIRFTFVHVFFAWMFKLFPSLSTIFINLFDYTTQLTMIDQYSQGFMLGITTHYSTLAIYLGNGFVVLWALMQFEKNKKIKNKYITELIIIGVSLTMIGKRGMLIFVILTVGIFSVITKSNNLKNAIPVIIKYIFIAFLIVAILVIAAYTIIPQLMITFERFFSNADISDMSSGRSKMWLYAITLFSENPVVGIGWFGYREAYESAWFHGSLFQQLDTHNVYLQLLCETGLIGFCIFMTVIFKTLTDTVNDLRKYIFYKSENDEYRRILSISVITQILFVLYCFTGNPLYDPQNFIIYFLSIGSAYSIHNIKNKVIK